MSDPSSAARDSTASESYVGKDTRFADWDEAAAASSPSNNPRFSARYTHEDWVRMAHRNCREDNGEIRFDYDMAIAAPFAEAAPTPQFDMWPLFRALAQKPLLVIRGERSDLLERRDGGEDASGSART